MLWNPPGVPHKEFLLKTCSVNALQGDPEPSQWSRWHRPRTESHNDLFLSVEKEVKRVSIGFRIFQSFGRVSQSRVPSHSRTCVLPLAGASLGFLRVGHPDVCSPRHESSQNRTIHRVGDKPSSLLSNLHRILSNHPHHLQTSDSRR